MNHVSSGDLAKTRRAVYVGTAAVLAVVYLLLRSFTWRGNAQIHTLMELPATLLAVIAGVLALARFYSKKENTFLFIGTGFIGTGLLDGYHTVVSATAFSHYFPSPPSLVPWSGFASRLFLAVLLWLSCAFWRREARLGAAGTVSERLVYLVVGLWMLGCFAFFVFVPQPVGYGAVPHFPRAQELIPAVFFVLALSGYLRKGNWKRNTFEHWLVLTILLSIAQSVYISTSHKLYDPCYVASHGLKILSYLSTLAGLLIAMYHLFVAEESIVTERTEKLRQEVAERRRAEEASLALARRERMAASKMREERAFSEAVIQALPAMVYIFNAEGRFLRWNTQLETTLGYSSWEVARLPVMEVVAEEDRQRIEENVQQVFEQGHVETEGLLVTKSGNKLAFHLTGARITVDDKPCVLGAALDITRRRAAEKELRENEAKLKLIFDSVVTGIVIIDPEGHRIVDANPVALRLIGAEHDQVVGAKCHQFICPAEEGQCPITDLGQVVDNSECVLITAGGERRAVIKTVVKMRLNGREHLLASFVDITERKQAEEELRNSEAKYQSLLANIPDVVWTSDEEGRLVFVTANSEKLDGYSPEESCQPGAWTGRIHAEDLPRVMSHYRALFQWDRAYDVEYRLRKKDGQWIWVHDRAIRTYKKNGKQYCDGVACDITARKQAEVMMLKAIEQAESANRAKSQFLANMSHELRTPLNGMMGMTELALQTRLTSEQREYLTMAKSSADSLLALINDILDFSKIEAGRLELESIEFNLRDLLESTVKLLAARAREKGLELRREVQAEAPETAVGDPTRLRQVLINLVGNAIKFTEKGEVAVKLEVEEAGAESTVLHFIVKDTGIGIPANRQEAIFAAFAQGDGSTTRRYGGSGLGLTVSRRLVEMCGGRLWLESTEGVGSTFHFTARLGISNQRREASKTPGAETTEARQGKTQRLRILLAEDNLVNRTLAVRLLERMEHSVEVAGNGREAVEKYKRGTFDLVLMDVQMPDLDGFEATAAIRAMESEGAGHIPIIAMTAYALKGDREKCLAAGMDGYISKPFRVEELLKELERHASEEQIALGGKRTGC